MVNNFAFYRDQSLDQRNDHRYIQRMAHDHIITGTNEAVEAEYGFTCDRPFILVHMYDDDVVSIEGFNTIAGLRAMIASDYADCPRNHIA